MTELSQDIVCRRCGQVMEAGYTTMLSVDGRDPRVMFVVQGEPIAYTLIDAFRQGLRGERPDPDEVYLLQGYRCPGCGAVELFAKEKKCSLLK